MTMMDVQSLVNALRRRYAAPRVDPEWVRQCAQALIEDGQQATLEAVHDQFLWSNLAHSTLPSNATPADPSSSQSALLFVEPTLLQIESITEIGSSAFQLQNTVNMRRVVIEGRTRIRRIDDPADGEEVDDANMPVYPRGMLRFELSDGRSKVRAIEYKRLNGLKLGETPLGCKLLVHRVRSVRGILLLQPENTDIIGGMIEDLEAKQAECFISSLKARMDAAARREAQPTVPVRRTRAAPRATTRPPPPRPARQETATQRMVPGPSTPNTSSRPQRAAGQFASARIGRMYDQIAHPDRDAVIGAAEGSDDEFESFHVDESFFRRVDQAERQAERQASRGRNDIHQVESDEFDDIDVDDSFIRQIDEVEMRSWNRRQVQKRGRGDLDTEDLEDFDSGKENKPIVIDSD
ncbi:hypothetical protein BD324DRAFT_620897 [Kockovaella imperatae]|uniref:RecQ-mediated genome instability protein 1 n=1 Tax=Kockovaella imperatae TaxID=4999 RepID=A0A1Y1ULM7_9TREE|nr:hypothetical protein BD324DRAFT_620897 [Kockovaella imperatae]ORX38447.1 hypothetical protein BD324DRAFT_620897 [Kockovaella imperatae]